MSHWPVTGGHGRHLLAFVSRGWAFEFEVELSQNNRAFFSHNLAQKWALHWQKQPLDKQWFNILLRALVRSGTGNYFVETIELSIGGWSASCQITRFHNE